MTDTAQMLALSNTATHTALAALTGCLLKNGGLKPGQFSAALREASELDGAARERFDYELLRLLTVIIDSQETASSASG